MGFSIDKKMIARFCRRNHIRKLSLFGSVLTRAFNEESDIDVLVEFDPDAVIGYFELVEMQEELATVFDGRKVDLRTPRELSRYFRDEVIEKAEVLYDAGR